MVNGIPALLPFILFPLPAPLDGLCAAPLERLHVTLIIKGLHTAHAEGLSASTEMLCTAPSKGLPTATHREALCADLFKSNVLQREEEEKKT